MNTNIVTFCQRWREHRDSYRPAGEPIRTREYEIAEIPDDNTARAFIERHHYSASFPAARARYGLYRRGELVGVSVLSQPASEAVLDKALPFAIGHGRAELGRFVLLDNVPSNGESWFQARCFELALRSGFDAIVSHSDPFPRTAIDGRVVFAGHVGTIYQALNAVYVGRANRNTIKLLPDGSLLSARALSKLRARDRGWHYVVETLLRHGAPEPAGDWRTWVTAAVGSVTRTFRHPGNHRYVWALDRRLRRHLPTAQPYPKQLARAA